MTTSLTNEQKSVLGEKKKGTLLVIAGPGSGKTFTLIERLKKDIDEYPNEKYKVLCFTKKAFQNIECKFTKKYPKKKRKAKGIKNNNLDFCTIHSFARQIIQESDHLTVHQSQGQKDNLLNNITEWLKDPSLNEQYSHNPLFQLIHSCPKLAANMIAKIRGLSVNFNNDKEIREVVMEEVGRWKHYHHKQLKKMVDNHKNNFIEFCKQLCDWYLNQPIEETKRSFDFYDEIETACEYMEEHNKTVEKGLNIYVDEFQDINSLQWRFIKSCKPEFLFCVGDPRQAIFSFQGSDNRIINDTKWFDNCIVLDYTFRFMAENACKNLNDFIKSSNMPNKEVLANLKVHETVKRLPENIDFVKKHVSPTKEKSCEWIAKHIKALQNIQPGEDMPTISILARSQVDGRLKKYLTQEHIKVPFGNRDKPEQGRVKGYYNRTNKIMLSLIIFNMKFLNKHWGAYENSQEDFYKCLNWLTGVYYRSGGSLTSKENNELLDNYIKSECEESFFEWVQGKFTCHKIAKCFDPIIKSMKGKFCSIVADKIHLSRESLTVLFREVIENNDFWKTPLKEWYMGFERKKSVDMFCNIENISQLFEVLATSCIPPEHRRGKNDRTISIDNVHQSKGKEYDYVFIYPFENNQWPAPYTITHGSDEIDPEEWRVLFVAISRARKQIFLVYNEDRVSLLGSSFCKTN